MKKTKIIISLVLVLIFAFGSLPCTVAFAAAAGDEAALNQEETAGGGDETGGDTGETPGEPVTPPETPADPPAVYEDVSYGSSFAEGLNMAGYKYCFRDNYFYVDRNKAWQGNFGYSSAYDYIAPYLLLEYDYVRVHFTYAGRDWMIQLWKGQYGLAFYGSEVGVYSKEASDSEDTVLSVYTPVTGEYMPFIQTTMYHDPMHIGEFSREFTTPYEQTWWSTGFKQGHLTVEEPANELRQTGVITFANAELANLFAAGLAECGFGTSAGKGSVDIDTYSVDGRNVYYSWQEISEAENTMDVKIAIGTMLFLNFAAFTAALVAILGGIIGLGFLMILI